MNSIRTKIIAIITSIIIVSLGVTGYLLIEQKRSEITLDIYDDIISFTELTVSQIIDDYKTFYVAKNFYYFQRDIKNLSIFTSNISSIKIADYNGNLLYDSIDEEYKQYFGPDRKITDRETLSRLKDVKPSMKTDQRIIYIMNDINGEIKYTDRLENEIAEISDNEKIINFIYPDPRDDQTRVIYDISYSNLVARLNNSIRQLIYALVFISALGIFIAVIFGNRIVTPLKKLSRGVIEIARGNLGYQVKVNTKDEIKTLADGFNKMAQDLKVTTKAMIEREQIARELEIAGKIQKNLIPPVPLINGLDLAASVDPAEDVGGDCYDFLKLDDQNHLIYLGDVTGHGIPASLVVAITNALFFTILDFYQNTKDIIVHANKVLKAKTEPNMFITAVLCNWNHITNTFTYASAGHEQIIHYHAKDKSISLCPAGGIALGMIADISKITKEETVQLEEGDCLFLYSDGIPEAWASKTDMLEMTGFEKMIKEVCADFKSSEDIRREIIKRVYKFMNEYPQADDITLMVIKRDSKAKIEKV